MIDFFCMNEDCRRGKNPLMFLWINKKGGNGVALCPRCGWPYLVESGTLLYTPASPDEIQRTITFCRTLDLEIPIDFKRNTKKNKQYGRQGVEKTYENRAETWSGIRRLIKEQKGEDNRLLRLAQNFIKNKDSPLTVVELGVGTGWKIAELKKNLKAGSQIVAFDISRQMCQQTLRNLNKVQNQVDTAVVICDITKKTPLPRNCVDLIIADKILHHLRRPQMALKEANRILKKGGKILAMVPGTEYQQFFTIPKLKYSSHLFATPLNEAPNDPLGRFSKDYLRKIFFKEGIVGFTIYSDLVFYTFQDLFSYFKFMDLTGADARLTWHKRNNRAFLQCEGYKSILQTPVDLTVECEFLTIEGEKT